MHVLATDNEVQQKNLFTLLLLFSFQSVEIVEVALVLSSSLQRSAAGSVAAVGVRGAALCSTGLRFGKKACWNFGDIIGNKSLP